METLEHGAVRMQQKYLPSNYSHVSLPFFDRINIRCKFDPISFDPIFSIIDQTYLLFRAVTGYKDHMY